MTLEFHQIPLAKYARLLEAKGSVAEEYYTVILPRDDLYECYKNAK